MRENEPDSCFIFLVGTKNDLLVSIFYLVLNFYICHTFYIQYLTCTCSYKPSEERQRTEKDAIRIATEMHAEFWAVSAKTGKTKSSYLPLVAAQHMKKIMNTGHPRQVKSHCKNLFIFLNYFQGKTFRGFSSGWQL